MRLQLLVIFFMASSLLIPNIVVAEGEWKVYNVTSDEKIFKVPYRMTNGEIEKIEVIDRVTVLIEINSDGVNNGTIEIKIPRDLIDGDYGGTTDGLFVLLDGKEVDFQAHVKTPCFRASMIEFLPGTKTIEIVQTQIYGPILTTVLPVNLTTDKNHYDRGEIITIQGCTSLNSAYEGDVKLDILDPNEQIFKTTSVTPNMDGVFSSSFLLEDNLAVNGTYIARGTYGNYTTTQTFVVPEFHIFILIVFVIGLASTLVFTTTNRNF